MQRIKHPQRLGDRLAEPDAVDASFVALVDGWAGDAERLHAGLHRHVSAGTFELVAVDNAGDDEVSQRLASLDGVVHLPLRDRVGWAAGRNLGLRQARGRIVVVADTSVEPTGDLLAALSQQLEDDAVGMVGAWGVSTADGFSFAESAGPDVDGVEAYLMALRRRDLGRTGLFDPKFTWYRNADIDFSFRVRDAGLRTVVDPDLPVVRHEHRLWASTPADERESRSRRNFQRFRARWGERRDLFAALEDGG